MPCAYKIGTFDVALDATFCRKVPNQRPEACVRANIRSRPTDGLTLGYRPGMAVLTVGDGDFSFSLAVARLVRDSTGARNLNLVATSYESEETLKRVYQNYEETAKELVSLGAALYFQVDATQLAKSLPPSVLESKFDRICWNFPCTAIEAGKDGQNDAMETNKQLVRDFVANAKLFVVENGEIQMCHKTKPPFNQWRIEEVAVEHCQGKEPIVHYCGRVVLDRCLIWPYQPRKALDRKSFPCHDACIYIFKVSSSNNIHTNMSHNTIQSKNYTDNDDDAEEECLIAVSSTLIMDIRATHLAHAAKKTQLKNGRKRKRRT